MDLCIGLTSVINKREITLNPVIGKDQYYKTGLRNIGNSCYTNVVIQCFKRLTENVKTSPVLKSKNLSSELLFLSTVLKNRWVPVVDTTSQFCSVYVQICASKHIMVLLILYSVVVWREVSIHSYQSVMKWYQIPYKEM